MLRRVNPIVLLGLILGIILSLGILAGAQGGGTPADALAVAEGQVGKPFVMGTDGPDTFSCVGLMRYALRTAGIDADAPWSPEAYLGRYAPVDPGNLQPGDIVIYPGWATMYAGNGMLVNANEMEGIVTHTPMDVAGTPLGIVRPGGGGSQPVVDAPIAADPAATDPMVADPMVADPAFADPAFVDPAAADPAFVDPAAAAPVATDPMAFDPAAADPMATDPMATDPMVADPMATEPIPTDPAFVDPAAADPAFVDPAAQQF